MRSRLIGVLVASLVIVVVLAAALPGISWLGAKHISVTDIHIDSGLRLTGTLSDAGLSDERKSTYARLDMVEFLKGGFLHRIDPVFGKLYAFRWLRTLYDANYPAATYERVTTLGPGEALDADIERKGAGRYSIWNGHVLFSLPEGKDLGSVGRLDVWMPLFPILAKQSQADIEFWSWQIGFAIAVLILLCWLTPVILIRNVGPGIATTLGLLIVLVTGAELYMRITEKFPKEQIVWPGIFDAEAGVVFKPNTLVRFTDGIQFWTQDTTNSLGFMDHEPVLPKPEGTFRILLVGDSIVEALQVPLPEKTQTLLVAALHKAYPDRKIDIVAVSRSGTGQANQLGLYKALKNIKPDLAILMFVGNDFANNSILLESLRSGFNPQHPPWWFVKQREDKTCERIPPDPNWASLTLPGGQEPRAALLSAMSPDYARDIAGLIPDFVDSVFYRNEKLPKIYEDAVDLTRCSIDLWKRTAETEGFRLLIAATDGVTVTGGIGQIRRLREVAAELQIPLFDMYPDWAAHGDILAGKFPFDGHWNATGHRWSADALFRYLQTSNYLGR